VPEPLEPDTRDIAKRGLRGEFADGTFAVDGVE
jgi:hypothetical protein